MSVACSPLALCPQTRGAGCAPAAVRPAPPSSASLACVLPPEWHPARVDSQRQAEPAVQDHETGACACVWLLGWCAHALNRPPRPPASSQGTRDRPQLGGLRAGLPGRVLVGGSGCRCREVPARPVLVSTAGRRRARWAAFVRRRSCCMASMPTYYLHPPAWPNPTLLQVQLPEVDEHADEQAGGGRSRQRGACAGAMDGSWLAARGRPAGVAEV